MNRVIFEMNAFINGIRSREIRQRLFENKTLTLDQAFEQARTLEMAQKNSAIYSNPDFHTTATDTCQDENITPPHNLTAATTQVKCFFCGSNKHPRKMCPAKDTIAVEKPDTTHEFVNQLNVPQTPISHLQQCPP